LLFYCGLFSIFYSILIIVLGIFIIGLYLYRQNSLNEEKLIEIQQRMDKNSRIFIYDNNTDNSYRIIEIILFFISSCVIAPILEELLFRGIILDGFMKNYGKWKAILINALIFSLAHIFTSLLSPFILYPGTVGLAWIYYKYKNLRLTIFCHYAYNFMIFLQLLIIVNDIVIYGKFLLSHS